MKRPGDFAKGFTIVETVLFLAITSMMIVGILVATGRSVDVQRYRDTIDSIKTKIQEQYSIAANPENGISGNYTCANSTINMGNVGYRGQSDCTIIGRYMTVSDVDAKSIDIYPVIGTDTSLSVGITDLEALQKSNLALLTSQKETYAVEWGSSMKSPDRQPITFTVLVARSPVSGTVTTLISDLSNASFSLISPKYMLNSTAIAKSLTICLDSGGVLGGNTMGVKINANSSSRSGIEMIGDAVSVADGGCT